MLLPEEDIGQGGDWIGKVADFDGFEEIKCWVFLGNGKSELAILPASLFFGDQRTTMHLSPPFFHRNKGLELDEA